jgi:hypothetical protein
MRLMIWRTLFNSPFVEVAFSRVMSRAKQPVRLILTSECQADLNSVVHAW